MGVSPAIAATSGTIEKVPTAPVWPAASKPWATGVARGVEALGDDRIHPGLQLALRLAGLPHQAEDLDPPLVGGVEHEGGAAEARADHRHPFVEEHVELLPGDRLVQAAPLVQVDPRLGVRDVVFLLDLPGEVPVALRDLGGHLFQGLGHGRGGGKDQVDSKGLPVHPLADPLDVGGDVVGGVHRLAQHRESARVDDGHRHVLAVGEGDDGVLDAEHVAELGSERILCHDGPPGSGPSRCATPSGDGVTSIPCRSDEVFGIGAPWGATPEEWVH
jgi:hypothetical protein